MSETIDGQAMPQLEALDFTPPVACEHSMHSAEHFESPATFFVESRCPVCGYGRQYWLCQVGWDVLGFADVQCRLGCSFYATRDNFLTVLHHLQRST